MFSVTGRRLFRGRKCRQVLRVPLIRSGMLKLPYILVSVVTLRMLFRQLGSATQMLKGSPFRRVKFRRVFASPVVDIG